MKEGGGSREFYMSELVTHVISDVPVDSEELHFKGQDHVTVRVSQVTRDASFNWFKFVCSFFLYSQTGW